MKKRPIFKKNTTAVFAGALAVMCAVSIPLTTFTSKAEKPAETTQTVTTTKTTETTKETAKTTAKPTLTYWDGIPLDTKLQDYIAKECERVNISPTIVLAIIERESNYKKEAIGDNGESFGLMQVKAKYHYQRMLDLGCTDLLDAYDNVRVGIDILAELVEQDNGIVWALMAYNGGRSYADDMTKQSKVSNYAKEVINRSETLGTRKKGV